MINVVYTTRPSWLKGVYVTPVHVWRPLAKISTANQRYAISYWWLTVTVAVLRLICTSCAHGRRDSCRKKTPCTRRNKDRTFLDQRS